MLNRLLVKGLGFVPTPVMRKLSSRYIAGEELADEMRTLTELHERGFTGIFDILGEGIRSREEASRTADEYIRGAESIAAAGIDAYVSIKPTHLGMARDEPLALDLYRRIATRCAELGLFMRVEMEDHPTTDATLRIFEALRRDFERVGIVLQSRLFRTPTDIEQLAPGPLDVRLVKGIYIEPAEIAHTRADPIREAFVACAEQLWDRGANVRLATHDAGLADRLFTSLAARGMRNEDCELQVLLGVQEPLWQRWKSEGRPVRVYVPFGPEWKAYSLRRLTRNPQLMRAVLKNLLTPG